MRAYLARHGMRLDDQPPPRHFAGGLANLNYLHIYLDGEPAVLRRPPMGELPAGAYDMAREHRILSRLPDALPFVPRSLHLCDDPTVCGQRFQILGHCRPGSGDPGNDSARIWPPVRTSVPACRRCCCETIAAIHAVDTEAIGLDDLGRPEGFLARAVSGWIKRGWAAKEDGTDALHKDIAAWLEANKVPDGKPGLLHNDFKLNNMILNPDDLSPVAVVDWDQGTRGDPLFDFATLLSYWIHADDPWAMHDMKQMPAVEAGLCQRRDAVAEYAKITGRDVSNILFHRVITMYKLSVIFLQLGLRYRSGATTEPRYAPLTAIGTGILEFTHEIAQGRAF